MLELASRDLGSGGQVGRRPLLVAEDLELGAVPLVRARRVEVVVRSADGAPVAGARVATAYDWASASPVLLPETTDEHGRANVLEFDSEGRSSGTEVLVIQPGHAVARRTARGGRVAVDLQRGTLRRLRVLAPAGAPRWARWYARVEQFWVRPTPQDGSSCGSRRKSSRSPCWRLTSAPRRCGCAASPHVGPRPALRRHRERTRVRRPPRSAWLRSTPSSRRRQGPRSSREDADLGRARDQHGALRHARDHGR